MCGGEAPTHNIPPLKLADLRLFTILQFERGTQGESVKINQNKPELLLGDTGGEYRSKTKREQDLTRNKPGEDSVRLQLEAAPDGKSEK
jgi:hypothetical protein